MHDGDRDLEYADPERNIQLEFDSPIGEKLYADLEEFLEEEFDATEVYRIKDNHVAFITEYTVLLPEITETLLDNGFKVTYVYELEG